MSIKLIAALLFVTIVISLGTALFQIVRSKDSETSAKALKALKVRMGLSILLFAGLVAALSLGLIEAHGIGPRMQHLKNAQPQTPPAPTSP